VGEDFPFFVGHRSMVDVIYKIWSVYLSWCWTEMDCTHIFSLTPKMEPYYAMEPNIW
jgi:hypothetical protein